MMIKAILTSVESVDQESLRVTIQMKAIEQYFPVVLLFVLYKLV